jgi:hypothetical protein
MKNKTLILTILSVVVMLFLAACGSPAETPAPVEEQSQIEAPAVEAPVEEVPVEVPVVEEVVSDYANYTDEQWEAFLVKAADGNHPLDFILSQNFTAPEWEAIIDRMIGYGSNINPEEKKALINWLINR